MQITFLEFKKIVHNGKTDKMATDKLYNLERNISVRISWFLYNFFPKIMPNHVTFVSILILSGVFCANFFRTHYLPSFFTIIQMTFLYFITITDKIDGEIARAHDNATQRGLYYDYTVHFFFPFVFYFTVGNYFYTLGGSVIFFYFTILFGVINMFLVQFRAIKILIGEIIHKNSIKVKDLIEKKQKNTKPLPRLVRFFDYLTFMLYAWTLFFYVLIIFLSYYNFNLSYSLYFFHVIFSAFVICFKVFWYYPHKKLFKSVH